MFLKNLIFIFLFLLQNKLVLCDNIIKFFFPNFFLFNFKNISLKKTETTYFGPISIEIGDENNISFGSPTYSGNFNLMIKDKDITFLTLGNGNIILKISEYKITE